MPISKWCIAQISNSPINPLYGPDFTRTWRPSAAEDRTLCCGVTVAFTRTPGELRPSRYVPCLFNRTDSI
jgi:hypothetical protein